MERFSINIDNAVKARLYELCRLCGMDNANKINILDQDSCMYAEGDIELRKKIFDCVGVQVIKNDQMPQQICSLCCDKINDFYEFREMCAATNDQTRKLLRLPPKSIANSVKTISAMVDEDGDEGVESIFGVVGGDEPEIKFDSKLAASKKTKKGAAITTKAKKAVRAKVKKETIKRDGDGSDASCSITISDEESDWVPNNKRARKRKWADSQSLLLAPKELNERERQREMEQKKNEKKNKMRKGDGKVLAVVDKRVKVESDVFCDICYENFETPKRRQSHFAKKHLVRTGEYGCSSCVEQHADEEENRLHHENVHKKKRVTYTCPMCTTSFGGSLPKFNNHVVTCVSPFYSTVDLAVNITCTKCQCEFETRNLYDWHGCFIASKRPCPKCGRVFVKKATLWRHIFACGAVAKAAPATVSHMVHIPNINISADSKRSKKSQVPPIKISLTAKTKAGRQRKTPAALKGQSMVTFKAEPETILDSVGESHFDSVGSALESDEATGSAHKSIASPGGTYTNDGDLLGFDVPEAHFGDDDDDSDAEPSALNVITPETASSLPTCSIDLEIVDFNAFPSITINNVGVLEEEQNGFEEDGDALDDDTHHNDDFEEVGEQVPQELAQCVLASQTAAMEETTDAIAVPSTSRAAGVRQPLTMRIKREVMHPDYGDVALNPTVARNIKRERSLHDSPLRHPNARKSTAKPTYTIIHSAPEQQLFDPVLARNIKREKGPTNQPDETQTSIPAALSTPASQPNGENASGALFDPVLARNIKREKPTEATRTTVRKSTAKSTAAVMPSTLTFDPALARNIKREKGTTAPQQQATTSNIVPTAGPSDAQSENPLFDPILARNIKREKDTSNPKATLRPNPLAIASTMADKSNKVSKKVYKMALLAEKIRQERLANERAGLSTEETSSSSTSSQPNTVSINEDSCSGNSTPLPVIATVMNANNAVMPTSDGIVALPIIEQTAEMAAIIPFKPIRISTEFRKAESASVPVTAPPSSAKAPEVVENQSSTPGVPLTISKVVSLTSVEAVETLPEEVEPHPEEVEPHPEEVEPQPETDESMEPQPETVETRSANVECDKSSEARKDQATESDEPKVDETDPNDRSAPSSIIDNMVDKSVELIADVNGNGHTTDLRVEPSLADESDFQSEMSSDKNRIMASLEAIQQIVTELEKSDHNNDVDEATSITEPDGNARPAESDSVDESDIITRIESDQTLRDTPPMVNENNSKMGGQQQSSMAAENTQHNVDTMQAIQGPPIVNNTDLEDISEDSMGF